jgi:CheY-like chemotaxis protein
MDGYELARRITGLGITCRLIAVTGYGTEGDRARSLTAGFAAHLTEPVTMAMMLAAITAGDPASDLASARPRTITDDECDSAADTVGAFGTAPMPSVVSDPS